MKRVKMTMKMFHELSRRYVERRVSDRTLGVLYSRHAGNVFVVDRRNCDSSSEFFWMVPSTGFMPALDVGNMRFLDDRLGPEGSVLYEIIVVPDGEEDYSEITSGKSLCI